MLGSDILGFLGGGVIFGRAYVRDFNFFISDISLNTLDVLKVQANDECFMRNNVFHLTTSFSEPANHPML